MKIVRDYYLVKIPGDIGQSLEGLADLAINEARERAKLYCMPAEWQATHIAGELGDFEVIFRVRRKRFKREGE